VRRLLVGLCIIGASMSWIVDGGFNGCECDGCPVPDPWYVVGNAEPIHCVAPGNGDDYAVKLAEEGGLLCQASDLLTGNLTVRMRKSIDYAEIGAFLLDLESGETLASDVDYFSFLVPDVELRLRVPTTDRYGVCLGVTDWGPVAIDDVTSSGSAVPDVTKTPTSTSTPTTTPTPSDTPAPSNTPTHTPTPTSSGTPTQTPTATQIPTSSPTAKPSATPKVYYLYLPVCPNPIYWGPFPPPPDVTATPPPVTPGVPITITVEPWP